jgi:Ca2+-transporting ATPase
MDVGPRNPRESVFSKEVKAYLVLSPILTTALLLTGYFIHQPWLGAGNLTEARTQLFVSMVLVELAVAVSCRSLRYSVFRVGLFKNKFLWLAVLSSIGLQLLVLYVPQLHGVFGVIAPTIMDWIIAVTFTVITFLAIETGKLVARRARANTAS